MTKTGTIVALDKEPVRMPRTFIEAPLTVPVSSLARRVLIWLVRFGDEVSAWSSGARAGGVGIDARLQDIRVDLGLRGTTDNRSILAALQSLSEAALVFPYGKLPIIEQYGHPSPALRQWVTILFSPAFARELVQYDAPYAMLSMTYVRQLKTALDVILYQHACLVDRRRHRHFSLYLPELAEALGRPRLCGWAALREPILGSLKRIAHVTGCRFRLVVSDRHPELAGLDMVQIVLLDDKGGPALVRRPRRGRIIEVDRKEVGTIA